MKHLLKALILITLGILLGIQLSITNIRIIDNHSIELFGNVWGYE